jgi:hypothetical protein
VAGRLRPHAAALIVLAGLLSPAGTALAAETWTCWSGGESDGNGHNAQVTRCRLSGSSETTDYGSAGEVPVVLRPQVGTDDSGLCWYWTTRDSYWVMLGVDDDGVATLGIDPDGEVGGPIIIDAEYPACTSDPGDGPSVLQEAYELLSTYRHPLPDAVLDPPPGAGVTGMEVFVAEAPPAPWAASLVSPHTGLLLEVETFVEAVRIDWGDGTVEVVPAVAFGLLTGWPDGSFGHVYTTKTCAVPGGPRCHPELSAYEVVVSYEWVARYRVDGGPWQEIPVPPTSTSHTYDVDEIISTTTAVG